ncbi:MAG: ABC transporter ATP-binding protein [Anaerotignaceae bacterium]
MNEIIFKATNLCKKYKSSVVLDNVNLTINKGDIYGFVGENGAGKTTLIKILTGNSFKSSGNISLFGATTDEDIAKKRRHIGAIIETPAFYPNMSAYDNLNLHAIQCGIEDLSRIDEVLELVSLENTKKRAKHFSLGMKQRLGLAFALLNNPDFIILDEPMNGLDPVGISELRELLKKLNRENNITILISSHLLNELSNIATRYGFISKGKLLKELSQKELIDECKQYLHIKTDNVERTVQVIRNEFNTEDYAVLEGSIKLYSCLDKAGEITKALALSSILVSEISVKGDDLENYYMNLIGVSKNA